MLKGQLIISLLFLFISFSFLFADKAYILKDKLLLSTNIISLQQLFNNECSSTFPIQFDKSRLYSNEELSLIISSAGLKNFILIGNGIRVEIIKRFSSPDDIADRLDIPAVQKLDVVRFFSINQLPNKFAVKEAVSTQTGEDLNISLTGYLFNNSSGIETNILFTIPVSPEIVEKKAQNDSAGLQDEFITLQNIYRSTAEMVYRKGPITIITKVKIRRKLEDNAYLVENYNSGKIMKVKVQEPQSFNQNQGL